MLSSREGQPVPNVTFQIRVNDEWQKISTDDVFKGKKVALLALPGAFTPTCSSTHLPRYSELAGVFEENAIDSATCLSVNDPFVMQIWKAAQNAEGIYFVPDGKGEFTDADSMLKCINPKAIPPARITPFSKPGCPHCTPARKYLAGKGYRFEEIALGNHGVSYSSLQAVTGRGTTPQIHPDRPPAESKGQFSGCRYAGNGTGTADTGPPHRDRHRQYTDFAAVA